MKTKLPNGCTCSALKVTPSNWHTKSAKTTIDWFIAYRFYDPDYPTPKQVKIKKMNSFRVLEERQAETRRLIQGEIEKLKGGLNPFTKLELKKTQVIGKQTHDAQEATRQRYKLAKNYSLHLL